jgi:Tol biopolymer transport system component
MNKRAISLWDVSQSNAELLSSALTGCSAESTLYAVPSRNSIFGLFWPGNWSPDTFIGELDLSGDIVAAWGTQTALACAVTDGYAKSNPSVSDSGEKMMFTRNKTSGYSGGHDIFYCLTDSSEKSVVVTCPADKGGHRSVFLSEEKILANCDGTGLFEVDLSEETPVDTLTCEGEGRCIKWDLSTISETFDSPVRILDSSPWDGSDLLPIGEILENKCYLYYISDQSGTKNIWRSKFYNNHIESHEQITFFENNYIVVFEINKNNKKIAFVLRDDGGTRGDVYLSDLDGSGQGLIPNQPVERAGSVISWSPDGAEIAFTLGDESNYHNLIVAKIKPDGADYSVIIGTNDVRGSATHKNSIFWDEEGMYIADTVQWGAHNADHEIFFRDNIGVFTNLTNTSGVGERYAMLSPDKTTLLFQTLTLNDYGLSVMQKSGGEQTVLIGRSADFIWPSGWYGNDRIIYTLRVSEGVEDIFISTIDGTEVINLTNDSIINQRDGKIYCD